MENLQAIALRDRASDTEVLEQLFTGETEEADLTEHQKEKLQQVRCAHALLLEARPVAKVTKKLMARFGLSRVSAWRVIRMTEALFGAARKANKDYKRIIAENMAMEAYRMAKKKGNHRDMNAAIANYIKLNGLDREDPDLPDFSKLQPSLNIVVVNPEIEEGVLLMLGKGPVDISELRRQAATEDIAPLEEIPTDGKAEDAG